MYRYLTIAILLLLPFRGYAACPSPLSSCPSPAFNTVNTANGILINSGAVLNALANVASPILGPIYTGGSDVPNPGALYFPQPAVVGYAESLGTGNSSTYDSFVTASVTASGTPTNHYGMRIDTLYLQGNGTVNGELNIWDSVFWNTNAGTTAVAENLEATLSNAGALGTYRAYLSNVTNQAGGSITNEVDSYADSFTNNNSSANVIPYYVAYKCNTTTGSGSAATFGYYCILNANADASISNFGHYSARPDVNVPALTSCGSGAALSASSSDSAGQITTGTGGTSCTLTFHKSESSWATVILIASDGGTAPTYTYSGSTISISTSRAGGVYQYWAIGTH